MAAVAKQRHASMPHNSNSDRRAFGSLNSNPTTTTKAKTGEKIKSFFRIASITRSSAPETSAASSDTDSVSKDREIPQEGGEKTPPPSTQQTKSSHGSRHSRFLPHIGRNRSTTVASEAGKGGEKKENKGWQVPAARMKGVPLDSGLETPGGEIADPFEDFSSVTLHHDGDHGHGHGRGESLSLIHISEPTRPY